MKDRTTPVKWEKFFHKGQLFNSTQVVPMYKCPPPICTTFYLPKVRCVYIISCYSTYSKCEVWHLPKVSCAVRTLCASSKSVWMQPNVSLRATDMLRDERIFCATHEMFLCIVQILRLSSDKLEWHETTQFEHPADWVDEWIFKGIARNIFCVIQTLRASFEPIQTQPSKLNSSSWKVGWTHEHVRALYEPVRMD